MSDDNSSLSFPFRQNNDEMSEYDHDYLTEHQEEISNNFNFDKPDFDPMKKPQIFQHQIQAKAQRVIHHQKLKAKIIQKGQQILRQQIKKKK